jgi:hypothetical protein
MESEPVGEPIAVAPITVSRVESDDGPAARAPVAPAEKELDQVAHELFGPLLRRLKAELQLDRERHGALIDLWH